LQLLAARMQESMGKAMGVPRLAAHAEALGTALGRVAQATRDAWSTGNPRDALTNAVPYMQAFGHVVLAWLWLDVAQRALSLDANAAQPATAGRLGAADYFFNYELPKIGAWLNVVERRDPTCVELPEEAF
ncbi:MAG: acyl-CoA dehydrogenase C-terminal domain-containing protein, partial [Proteobacteria bacterium]|nr:acyl-CoA dehydrogenase C-terminal domain-containing protein [Pseudomonadota bacterium]